MPMPRLALTDHRSFQDVQSRNRVVVPWRLYPSYSPDTALDFASMYPTSRTDQSRLISLAFRGIESGFHRCCTNTCGSTRTMDSKRWWKYI